MCGNNAIYVLCLLFEKDSSISYGDAQVDLFFFALAFLKKMKTHHFKDLLEFILLC